MKTLTTRSSGFQLRRALRIMPPIVALSAMAVCAAQNKPVLPAPDPSPDVLVLANGDTLHGKLFSETGGKVTFHSDPLGDLSIPWDKIRELHATEQFGVLNSAVKMREENPQARFLWARWMCRTRQ